MYSALTPLAIFSAGSDTGYFILGIGAPVLITLALLSAPLIIRKSRAIARAKTAELVLTASETTLRPGQEFEVAMRLASKTDYHIRSASVQLVRVETWVNSRRHKNHVSYHPKKRERTVVEEVLAEEQELLALHNVDTAAKLTVPRDVVPTLQGRPVHGIVPGISWKVKVECDIPSKVDLFAEEDIVIHRPPGVDVPPQRPALEESVNSVCALSLALKSADVCSYGNVEGVLKARMLKEATVSRVVVVFGGHEQFGDESVPVDIGESILAQKETLQSGQTYEWPFKLYVGKVDVPSMITRKTVVEYAVIAKLDRTLRRDPSVSQTVTLFI